YRRVHPQGAFVKAYTPQKENRGILLAVGKYQPRNRSSDFFQGNQFLILELVSGKSCNGKTDVIGAFRPLVGGDDNFLQRSIGGGWNTGGCNQAVSEPSFEPVCCGH